MTGERSGVARAVVPAAIGVLLGFIAGYFAGGGGRPGSPAGPAGEDGGREASLRQAIEKDPENPKLLAALGNFYYDRENWDGAIAAYERARRKASKDPSLLSDLGAAYRGRGEFRMAESCFSKAREADPNHWQSLVNLTLLAAYDLRDSAGAKLHLEELKRRFPGVPGLDRIEKQIASLPGKS